MVLHEDATAPLAGLRVPLAGSVVVVLPVLLVFLFLQRRIIQGVAMTGIK